jgi:uncharacterized protein (UPF0261 family)
MTEVRNHRTTGALQHAPDNFANLGRCYVGFHGVTGAIDMPDVGSHTSQVENELVRLAPATHHDSRIGGALGFRQGLRL